MLKSLMDAPSLPTLSLRRYGASPGSHAHDHFQLLWGWQGALELEIEGRGARMTAGRAAVIPPGARHDFWAGDAMARGARCFVVDTADPALGPLAGRVLDTPPSLVHLLQYLSAQPVAPPAAASLLVQSLWTGDPQAARRARPRRRIDWAVLEAWVDAHLAEPIDAAALAARVNLSPSQFAARCVEQHGLPPLSWLRERRLAAARRLRGLGLPVARVAERCGYRSPSALTAALRRAG